MSPPSADPNIQEKTAGMPQTPQRTLQQTNGDKKRLRFKKMLRSEKNESGRSYASSMSMSDDGAAKKPEKWSMGILNDSQTDEVPGE